MASTANIAGTADDPTIEFTPVKLGGKTYQLFFNLKALAKAQRLTGINFLHEGIDFSKFEADTFTHLIYAGLGKAHPDVTAEEVSDLVAFRDLSSVMAAVVTAFGASQSEADPEKDPPKPAPAA